MSTRMSAGKPAANGLRYLLALSAGFLALSVAAPARAQYACTTNYCISSQSISFQTPPEWPAVPVETCCRTHWGALPGAIDWSNGAPIMICAGRPDYVTSFPNCGDPQNVSQAFPLDYERPTFQARNLRVHGRGELPEGREGLLRRAQQLQAQSAIVDDGTIARQRNAVGERLPMRTVCAARQQRDAML